MEADDLMNSANGHRTVVEASPPVTVAGIRAAIAPVLERLAAGAAQRDADRDLPRAEIRELAELGLLRLRVRREDGGAGATLRELAETIVEIARADSNVAQALRTSFLIADRLAAPHDDEATARILERVLAGHLFAGTRNERGGAPGAVDTTIRRDGAQFVIEGAKYYSTGGLYADWFSGTATDEDGAVVSFTVPTDRSGVEVLDDFDAVGQRLTASGTTRLRGVRVTADEFDRLEGGVRTPGATLAQLYLAAVEAGIAAAALDDAVAFARERARTIKHSSAQRAVDDPYVRHVVGEISARVAAGRAGVLIAAEELEAAQLHAASHPQAGNGRLDAAAVATAQAQVIAAESALRSSELLFDVGGGSATDRRHNFDRHWRNARTVANHNPRTWKLAVVGAYRLTGEPPPASGLF
jgi:alkylation response protein AidB-like acyl-CoA dehydrogenase